MTAGTDPLKQPQTWQEVLAELTERLERIEYALDLLIRLEEKVSGTFPRQAIPPGESE